MTSKKASANSPFYGIFAESVRTPDQPVPVSVVQSEANPSVKRFNVYRNNHYASLIDALVQQFPATHKAAGKKLFRTLARHYAHNVPPTSPVMLFYGDGFADFIEKFAFPRGRNKDKNIILSQLAKLDYTCRLAYHAEDAPVMTFEHVTALLPEAQSALCCKIHPAAHWSPCSSVKTASLWLALVEETAHDTPSALLDDEGFNGDEVALITRPGLDVLMTSLPLGSDVRLNGLKSGLSLGEALAIDDSHASPFPIAEFLAKSFGFGAFCHDFDV